MYPIFVECIRMKTMKEKYLTPEMEIVEFEAADIVTASDEYELPEIP